MSRIRQDVHNNVLSVTVLDVRSERFWNRQDFLTKSVKEILWDHKLLSDDTGCRKTQVSDCISSTICKKESMLSM